MDTLVLQTRWSKSEFANESAVVGVEGLLVHGAKFDGEALVDPSADDPSDCPTPVCYLAWVAKVSDFTVSMNGTT
jgi:hypothetical protein